MEAPDRLFRDLCDNAYDLIQSVSPDGRFLYVNRSWLRTLGYRKEEVAGLRVFDVIHADCREHCQQVMQKLMQTGEAAQIEADFQAKDGRKVQVEGSATCSFQDGRPVATRGIFRDVTARKRAEEELDQLFNVSPDLLCIAGMDGYFKRINPAFGKTLGYTTEELLSRSFLDFVHPDDLEDTLGEMRRQRHGAPLMDFETRYRAKDGTYLCLAWRASLPSPGQGLVYAVGRDITEHKRDQERLAQQAVELGRSNADLEQFAYVASHDLLAPLRSITQLADWLREDVEKGSREEASRHLEELQARVHRMETLTEDLLDYSRAGSEIGEVTEVDTAALVRELTFLLAPPEGLHVLADASLPVLATARAPLELVLRNLVGNAIKHHRSGEGEVVVSARHDGAFYLVSVADDGPGIAAKFHRQVFQMFQKLESRDRVEGNGIGLPLVQRIVEGFGGQVTLESSKGEGATFRFTWPEQLAAGKRGSRTKGAS